MQITDPAQLVHLPWFQELGTNEVADWFLRHGISLDRPLIISHMPGHLILDAVCDGEGITYTARQWAKEEIRSGDLIELFPEEAFGYFLYPYAAERVATAGENFCQLAERSGGNGNGTAWVTSILLVINRPMGFRFRIPRNGRRKVLRG
jgi:DNA-binding transcriptional LysR family regulator